MVQLTISYEVLDVLVMFGRTNIFNAAQTYFGQVIMIQFPALYYGAITANECQLNEIMKPENLPPIVWRDKGNSFKERSCPNKFCRLIYKFYRGFFVSAIYYVFPMVLIIEGHASLYFAQNYLDENSVLV